MGISNEKQREFYQLMVKIREFENHVQKEYATGDIPGFIHLYAWQEAVATGVCAHLRKGDYVTSTHRGHGHCIAVGCDLKWMMAEIFGKATGLCKGKGGSMHIADMNKGMLGANGIVGGGLGLAVGAALSCKSRNSDNVAICFFGDGACSQGIFHEAINLASIWELPVIFVAEINGYAEATPISYTMKVDNVAERASSYGIPGITVDGMRVLQVYDAAGDAFQRAREGKGPTLLECKTWRLYGHSEGDAQKYKSKEEVKRYKEELDPIGLFERELLEKSIANEEFFRATRDRAAHEVEEAIQFARQSEFPNPEEALEDVYVNYLA